MTTQASGGGGSAHASRVGSAGYGEAQAGMSTVQPPSTLRRSAPQGGRARSRAAALAGAVVRGPVGRHLLILAAYLAAGIALTWPRAVYLVEGKLPATRDAGVYVWDFWWMLHQVQHLGNPWFTRFIAAPEGAQLGYHALMPLEGFVMIPVTLAFGPSASYNLLSILMPGLLSYAAYRAARLWLPTQTGAIAAGAFYGLSSDLAWHAWYQLNLAVGMLFLPLALEAAVRVRRQPGWRQAIVLGLVLGAALLTDQESAVLTAIVAVTALLPWLLQGVAAAASTVGAEQAASAANERRRLRARPANGGRPPAAILRRVRRGAGEPRLLRRLVVAAAVAAVALVVASPQIAAMVAQARAGGSSYPLQLVARYYVTSSTSLPGAFAISPMAVHYGLTFLLPYSYRGRIGDGVPSYGLALSVLAVAGLALSWRRRSARWLALLWLGATVLALGSGLWIGRHIYVPAAETWHGVRVSAVMPFTWFVQVPGMSGFREAGRFMMLGLLPASLLAGAAVDRLRRARGRRLTWLIAPVALLALLEGGWAGDPAREVGVMHTALPALDRPIAADRSGSIVVDVPFGVRGGVPLPGEGGKFDPEAQVLATADGHPRAVAYLSRLPAEVLSDVRRNPFYSGLLAAQGAQSSAQAEAFTGTQNYPALLAAARGHARRMNVGWIIVWHSTPSIQRYLAQTGFRFSYRADGASVYRPAEVMR